MKKVMKRKVLPTTTIITDPNFKPTAPTRVLKAVRGITTVIVKLFGPVSADRQAREELGAAYRADQLNPVPKRPERIYYRDPAVERDLEAAENW